MTDPLSDAINCAVNNNNPRFSGGNHAEAVKDAVNPGLLAGDGEVEPIVEPKPSENPGFFDRERAEAAVRELLLAVGEDPDREGLRETPARVARSYEEVFAGLHVDPTEVLGKTFAENHQELVLVRDVPIYSTCEHHLVPFYGVAHIGYIPGPDGHVTGLSKLARLADMYAKRPQVQERLTSQIADALVDKLHAQSVIVVIECEHLCMAMRGIRKPGATTTTSAVRGGFKRNAASRAEVLSLIRG